MSSAVLHYADPSKLGRTACGTRAAQPVLAASAAEVTCRNCIHAAGLAGPREPAEATLILPLTLALGVRAALASQIAWLESLHPTRSRLERLNMLRPLHEQLRLAMGRP